MAYGSLVNQLFPNQFSIKSLCSQKQIYIICVPYVTGYYNQKRGTYISGSRLNALFKSESNLHPLLSFAIFFVLVTCGDMIVCEVFVLVTCEFDSKYTMRE